jgi:hypothetical protein
LESDSLASCNIPDISEQIKLASLPKIVHQDKMYIWVTPQVSKGGVSMKVEGDSPSERISGNREHSSFHGAVVNILEVKMGPV